MFNWFRAKRRDQKPVQGNILEEKDFYPIEISQIATNELKASSSAESPTSGIHTEIIFEVIPETSETVKSESQGEDQKPGETKDSEEVLVNKDIEEIAAEERIASLIHQRDPEDLTGEYEWKYNSTEDWGRPAEYTNIVKERIVIETNDLELDTPVTTCCPQISPKCSLNAGAETPSGIDSEDSEEDQLADSLDAFIQHLIELSDAMEKKSSSRACDVAEIVRCCSESISAIATGISNQIRILTECECVKVTQRSAYLVNTGRKYV
jgi:hypothetical protein